MNFHKTNPSTQQHQNLQNPQTHQTNPYQKQIINQHNQQANYFNNFLRDFHEEQKRTSSAVTGGNKMIGMRGEGRFGKTKESLYLKDERRVTLQQGSNNIFPTKPILTGFAKHGPPKFLKHVPHHSSTIVQQQTSVNFGVNNSRGKQGLNTNENNKNKFYQTVNCGFLNNQRPISKQQPRPKGFLINNHAQILHHQQYLQSKSNYIESDAQQFDQRDRDMLKDLENDSFFNQKAQNQRPQTSKGTRKKSNFSQYHQQVDEDLMIGLKAQQKPPSRKNNDSGLNCQEFRIPIRSVFIDQKNRKIMHPISAHFKTQQQNPQIKVKQVQQAQTDSLKKGKKLDELIKYNHSKGTNSIKKSNSQMTVPFQTSIDSQFLSLFATTSNIHSRNNTNNSNTNN